MTRLTKGERLMQVDKSIEICLMIDDIVNELREEMVEERSQGWSWRCDGTDAHH